MLAVWSLRSGLLFFLKTPHKLVVVQYTKERAFAIQDVDLDTHGETVMVLRSGYLTEKPGFESPIRDGQRLAD